MASVFDELRASKAQIAAKGEQRLTLGVPGYAGRLAVRYKRIEWEQINDIVAGQLIDSEAELNGAADLLIHACEYLLVASEDELKPIHEVAEDYPEPVRFTTQLAEILEIDANDADGQPNARLIVRRAFAGGDETNSLGDAQMVAQQNKVHVWLSGAEVADETDFS